jgi:hypothetical protein
MLGCIQKMDFDLHPFLMNQRLYELWFDRFFLGRYQKNIEIFYLGAKKRGSAIFFERKNTELVMMNYYQKTEYQQYAR